MLSHIPHFNIQNQFVLQPNVELEALVKLIDGKLTPDDEQAIEEMHQYLIEGEGSWALGE